MSTGRQNAPSGLPPIVALTRIALLPAFRLVGRWRTTGSTYWIVVLRLLRRVLLASFTLRGRGSRVVISIGLVRRRNGLLRTRMASLAAGCTGAGIWRAGGLTGCLSSWVVRTARSSFAGSGSSLARSRRRCDGGPVLRRLLWLRGKTSLQMALLRRGWWAMWLVLRVLR